MDKAGKEGGRGWRRPIQGGKEPGEFPECQLAEGWVGKPTPADSKWGWTRSPSAALISRDAFRSGQTGDPQKHLPQELLVCPLTPWERESRRPI